MKDHFKASGMIPRTRPLLARSHDPNDPDPIPRLSLGHTTDMAEAAIQILVVFFSIRYCSFALVAASNAATACSVILAPWLFRA